MSDKYKIYDPDKAYFLTLTVVGWIDIFTRKNHKLLIVKSLQYCQKEKGLIIFGWCLMPSHLHLIASSDGKYKLSDILRDFKKFTSKKLVEQIFQEPESRRDWILHYLEQAGKNIKRVEKYKFWQDGNHAEIIYSTDFFYQKLKYIHQNPIKEMIVQNPEDYLFSSARNYVDRDYLIEIVKESAQLISF